MSHSRFVLSPAEGKPNNSAAALVSANIALQKALQQLQQEDRSKIVLRCDDLPHCDVATADLEKVFSSLLHMILEKKTDVAKLFLHISCTSEVVNDQPGSHLAEYQIQFNSNIVPTVEWYRQHELQISDATAILHQHNGRLLVHPVKNGGCIFSVSLPGKMQ